MRVLENRVVLLATPLPLALRYGSTEGAEWEKGGGGGVRGKVVTRLFKVLSKCERFSSIEMSVGLGWLG